MTFLQTTSNNTIHDAIELRRFMYGVQTKTSIIKQRDRQLAEVHSRQHQC